MILCIICSGRNLVTSIQICLANLSSRNIVNTRERTFDIMPILTFAEEIHGMIDDGNV